MPVFDSNVFIFISRNTGLIYAYFKKSFFKGENKAFAKSTSVSFRVNFKFPWNIPASLAGPFNSRVSTMRPEAHHRRGAYVRAQGALASV